MCLWCEQALAISRGWATQVGMPQLARAEQITVEVILGAEGQEC